MNLNFLEFEQPIAELEAKIEELRFVGDESAVSITDEIERLQAKSRILTETIFSSLSAWQVAQLARHPLRPYTLDYLSRIFTDFEELHGDRTFGDDPAIVAGVARLDSRPVAIIGEQKGRDTKEKVRRNFGMPRPEGYRKALRIMKLAERMRLPLMTFIDTPGAYPGVGDRVLMLQYSIYSVISPEGCASILWKSADKASDAAEAMGITAERLKSLGLVDAVLKEPLGGAHRNVDATAATVKKALVDNLSRLEHVSMDELLEARYKRFTSFGTF